MKIIQQRERIESISYSRSFWYEGHIGWGFGFPCDKDGNLIEPNKDSLANYQACLTGEVDGRKVIDKGVERIVTRGYTDRIGLCSCGREVILNGFTNTCDCGLEYNSSGQQLAPRSQWGYETGEHPCDIARIP